MNDFLKQRAEKDLAELKKLIENHFAQVINLTQQILLRFREKKMRRFSASSCKRWRAERNSVKSRSKTEISAKKNEPSGNEMNATSKMNLFSLF